MRRLLVWRFSQVRSLPEFALNSACMRMGTSHGCTSVGSQGRRLPMCREKVGAERRLDCFDFLMEMCSPHGVEIMDDLKRRDEVPEWNDPVPMIRRHLASGTPETPLHTSLRHPFIPCPCQCSRGRGAKSPAFLSICLLRARHHFHDDVIVWLFVFSFACCDLRSERYGLDGGLGILGSSLVLANPAPPCLASGRAVRQAGVGPRAALEGSTNPPRAFLNYVTTLWPLVGFHGPGRGKDGDEARAEERESTVVSPHG